MRIGTLAIVGVGLLGGSVGLAVQRRRLADRVIGVETDPQNAQQAKARGAVDHIATNLSEACQADWIILGTPVDRTADLILQLAPMCKPGALITDVGSTKVAILRGLTGKLPDGVNFVGSHPLAGSDKQGPDHADAELFRNRVVVVTPDRETNQTSLNRVVAFWEALEARVLRMTPKEHDRILARTSHVPHLVASALAGSVPAEMLDLTGTGFRDATRIAAGSPSLWEAILLSNREEVLAALGHFTERLDLVRQALERQDVVALERLLQEGKERRDSLDSRRE